MVGLKFGWRAHSILQVDLLLSRLHFCVIEMFSFSERPMPHLAAEIANTFLNFPGAKGRLTQMQLQKLCYLAHGWNLAINQGPLISDRVEAWDYGPVFPDLYDHTKFFGKNPLKRLITPDDDDAVRFFFNGENDTPYSADLSTDEAAVIERVWKRYGQLSAYQLSNLTHQPGTPWFQIYRQSQNDKTIPDPLIEDHFLELGQRAA